MKIEDSGRRLALMLLAVALVFAWMGTQGSPLREHSLDVSAQGYVDAGLRRALVTFATARTLNAALSLAQGTQLSAQPLGVGVQVGVGQLLRPINEVVGQFGDLMLMACIAFGAMEMLIRVGSHWAVTLALSIVAVPYAAYRWRGTAVPFGIGKLLAVLLFLRFAVPVVAIGNDTVYRTFLSEDYNENQQAIALSTDRIGKESPAQPAPAETGKIEGCGPLPDWLCRKIKGAPNAEPKAEAEARTGLVDRVKEAALVDLPGRVGKLLEIAESMTEHVVRLMVVFLLQTLIVPLVLGWVLLRGVGALLQGRRRAP